MAGEARGVLLFLLVLWVATVAVCGQEGLECTVSVQPCQSIQAAIDAAPDGAVICLSEGEWEEDLVIEKALTVRGEGAGKTVIRGTGSAPDALAIYCLDAEQSGDVHVQIEGLTITGAGRAGISIATEIHAAVSGCEVQGNGVGVFLLGESEVEIQDCVISENGEGINGFESARATIVACNVSDNANAGIGFAFSAEATISDSTVSENGRYGVYLAGSAQATISSSVVADNQGNGVSLMDSCQATLNDCSVTENGLEYAQKGSYYTEGIILGDEAQAVLNDCTVSGNANEGILLRSKAHADISGTTVSENGRVGVWLWDTAQATLARCTISDHPSAGVDARNETRVEMTACTVERNFTGVVLWGSPYAMLEANTIRDCEQYGVTVVGPNGEIVGFTGYIAGVNNLVTDNGALLNCDPCRPQYLCFLASEEGGELDKRE